MLMFGSEGRLIELGSRPALCRYAIAMAAVDAVPTMPVPMPTTLPATPTVPWRME
jgi:hypothetical protein